MHHEGHRKRLQERFESHGLAALHDHEIIELFLTYVIPRKDTKPIAKELVRRYRTIGAVLNAPAAELTLVPGIGARSAQLLSLVREIASYCLRERYSRESVIARRSDVEEYLRFHFGMRRDEFVAALYLDSTNHCIATDVIAEGIVNQCAIYPRVIVEKGLAHGAAGVILAHNHPGGTANPSRSDWQLTERIFTIGKLLDMPLLDHVIILQDKVVSLRELPRWPKK